MQDDFIITSSQELPLSQENFSDFFSGSVDPNDFNCNDITQLLEDYRSHQLPEPVSPDTSEVISPMLSSTSTSVYANVLGPSYAVAAPATLSVSPSIPSPMSTVTSCLPAVNNWSGDYGFDIYFEPPEEKKGSDKKVAWIYSAERDKLYVSKGIPCPVNFTADMKPFDSSGPLQLRVQAIYSQPAHSSDVVKRCINHIIEDQNAGILCPNYLVRCECNQADYVVDSKTNQFSVVVPFQNPLTGQNYCSYIFKFMCFSSCPGGLNRRPITVIFTLEKGGAIVGRRSVAVKICACPSRDCRNDDKSTSDRKREKKQSYSRKRKMESHDLPYVSEVSHFINKMSDSAKKTSHHPNKDGLYAIYVKDKAEYEFLRHSQQLYELNKTMQQLGPEAVHKLKGLKKKLKKESDTSGSD